MASRLAGCSPGLGVTARCRLGAAARHVIAILVCADTLFVLSLAGLFAGTFLLAGAAICLVIASVRWPVA